MVFDGSCISESQTLNREIDADVEIEDGPAIPTMDGRSIYQIVSYDLRGVCYSTTRDDRTPSANISV